MSDQAHDDRKGLTESERVLGQICQRAFLSLWTYQNLFIDRKRTKNGGGKELCDALLVFENDLVVFSVKHCKATTSERVEVDWNRWLKRAVLASAKQAAGATRWLIDHPHQIFVDPQCTVPFPIEIPSGEGVRIHRVVVALGGLEPVQRESPEVQCLIVNTMLDHSIVQGERGDHELGHLGEIDGSQPFCHVFDEFSILRVLEELDTAKDFILYLYERERLFREVPYGVIAECELGLLAIYMSSINEQGEHALPKIEDQDVVVFPADHWTWYSGSEQYRAKKEADRLSYFWDDLIERFTTHILGGTDYFSSTKELSAHERALRKLAGFRRLVRREHAKALFGLLQGSDNQRCCHRHVFSDDRKSLLMLVTVPIDESRTPDEYRLFRREYLGTLAYAMSHDFPDLVEIVGLATEPGLSADDRSEDLLYLSCVDMPEAEREYAAECSRIHNRRQDIPLRYVKGQEYPDVDTPSSDSLE